MNQFSIKTHCPDCFESSAEVQCKQCGFIKKNSNDINYLPEFTEISENIVIGRVLKSGGFGVVYAGLHEKLNLKIAIKEYFPEKAGLAKRAKNRIFVEACDSKEKEFAQWRDAFFNEAQIIAKFQGKSHIVLVTDVKEKNGTNYMVMERIKGQTLESLLGSVNKQGKLKKNSLMMMPVN